MLLRFDRKTDIIAFRYCHIKSVSVDELKRLVAAGCNATHPSLQTVMITELGAKRQKYDLNLN